MDFFSTAVPYSSLIFPLFLDTYVSYRSPIFLVSYTFDNSEALLSTNQTYLMGAVKSSTRTTLLTKISIFQNFFIVFFLSLVSPKYFEFGSAVSYFFKKIQYCLLLTRLLLKKKCVFYTTTGRFVAEKWNITFRYAQHNAEKRVALIN